MPEPRREVLAPVLDRNVRALVERRRRDQRRQSWQERAAARITAFSGSMPFVYAHLVLFGGWIVWNLPGSGLPRFDPSLVVLAMAASVEAIFLSTFILITQNRMQAAAERRAELDLQINLLSEHEVTRLIRLVSRIAAHLGVEDPDSPELRELARDVEPEHVLEHIERVEREEERPEGPESR